MMRGGSVVAQAAKGVFGRYHMLMQKQPLFTKMGTGFCVFSMGDITSQMVIERKEELDLSRTLRTAAFGAVFSGWIHHWWGGLEMFAGRLLPVDKLGNGKLPNMLCKLFLDQVFGAMVFNTGYVYSMARGEGMEHAPAVDRCHETVPDQMRRHWQFWPIFHGLNFYFAPLHYRVVLMSFAQVGWSCSMSYHLQGGAEQKKKQQKQKRIISQPLKLHHLPQQPLLLM
jgi:hypothetical protein